jgi:hypothetical protein
MFRFLKALGDGEPLALAILVLALLLVVGVVFIFALAAARRRLARNSRRRRNGHDHKLRPVELPGLPPPHERNGWRAASDERISGSPTGGRR